MAKILIPMWYYDSGYAGTVSGLSLSMSGQDTGYEVYKAFTSDDREYLKVTSSNIIMTSPYTASGTQGVVMISEDFFTSTSNLLYLYKDDNIGFSSPTVKLMSAIYGDGTSGGGGTYIYAGGSPITGRTKTFAEYIGTETSYQYFRFTIGPAPLDQEIIHLCHGIVYDLPDGYRVQDQNFNYKYSNSIVRTNLVGNIYWDGFQNNSIKKSHALMFEYLNSTQKDMLLNIFQLGKGGLPVWFIDDETDNDTWMFVGMTTMTVSEPYVEYFNVTINLVEY